MMINGSLTPNERNMFPTQIKQDIAISAQFEHGRHSTHKRGSYTFYKRRQSTNIYIPKLPGAQLYIS
jgi:hypothetical protein